MMFYKKISTQTYLLMAIYTLNFFPILLNFGGVFSDDWTFVNHSFTDWSFHFDQNGGWIFSTPIHWLLLEVFGGIYAYRVGIFFIPFLTGLFLYKTLKMMFPEKKEMNLILTTLYLTAPIMQARINGISFPSLVGVFYFFLGFYFYLKSKAQNKMILKIISLLLFFYSFRVYSLLVFYSIPFLMMLLLDEKGKMVEEGIFNLKRISKEILSHWIFIIIPFVSFIFFRIISPAKGIYARSGYNQFKVGSLGAFVIRTYKTTMSDFSLILNDFDRFSFVIAFGVVATVCIIFYFSKRRYRILKLERKTSIGILSLGVLSYFAAKLPYSLVGKIPFYFFHMTRHELLYGLSISLIVTGILSLIAKYKTISKALFIVIICYFSVINTQTYYSMIKLWFYHESLGYNLKESQVIKQHDGFIVHEKDIPLYGKLRSRKSFYEYSGLSREVLGNSSKFYIGEASLRGGKKEYIIDKAIFKQPHYNLAQFKGSWLSHDLYINKNRNIDNLETAKLLWEYLFDKVSFQSKISKLITIKFKKRSSPIPIVLK